jgi:hypothetical protein
MYINKNFVHGVGNQQRLYYDAARSTNHQAFFSVSTLLMSLLLLSSSGWVAEIGSLLIILYVIYGKKVII